MNKKGNGFLLTVTVLILAGLVVLYTFLVRSPSEITQLEVTDLQGNSVEMKELTELPTVVNFWATWCGPCIKEFPYFEEMRKEFQDEVTFIMVSDEPVEKIKAFISLKPYDFVFLKSTKKLTNYGIISLPTSCFYYPEGKFSTKRTGSLTPEILRPLITAIYNSNIGKSN